MVICYNTVMIGAVIGLAVGLTVSAGSTAVQSVADVVEGSGSGAIATSSQVVTYDVGTRGEVI